MSSYKGDPHWMTAKYPGKCAGKNCIDKINKGDRIFYYPKYKDAFVGKCAEAAEKDFTNLVQDEDYYNNVY